MCHHGEEMVTVEQFTQSQSQLEAKCDGRKTVSSNLAWVTSVMFSFMPVKYRQLDPCSLEFSCDPKRT